MEDKAGIVEGFLSSNQVDADFLNTDGNTAREKRPYLQLEETKN